MDSTFTRESRTGARSFQAPQKSLEAKLWRTQFSKTGQSHSASQGLGYWHENLSGDQKSFRFLEPEHLLGSYLFPRGR